MNGVSLPNWGMLENHDEIWLGILNWYHQPFGNRSSIKQIIGKILITILPVLNCTCNKKLVQSQHRTLNIQSIYQMPYSLTLLYQWAAYRLTRFEERTQRVKTDALEPTDTCNSIHKCQHRACTQQLQSKNGTAFDSVDESWKSQL